MEHRWVSSELVEGRETLKPVALLGKEEVGMRGMDASEDGRWAATPAEVRVKDVPGVNNSHAC